MVNGERRLMGSSSLDTNNFGAFLFSDRGLVMVSSVYLAYPAVLHRVLILLSIFFQVFFPSDLVFMYAMLHYQTEILSIPLRSNSEAAVSQHSNLEMAVDRLKMEVMEARHDRCMITPGLTLKSAIS